MGNTDEITIKEHQDITASEYGTDSDTLGYSTPERLVTSTSDEGEADDDKDFQEYLENQKWNRFSKRRGSRLSQKDIYGDLDDKDVALIRQQTRDTVRSLAQRYDEEDVVVLGGANDEKNTGDDLQDIDPELITWDGPSDPENPRNWTSFRKWKMMMMVILYATVSPLSSSIMSPALPKISEHLHITNSVVQILCVSIFILAWCFAPLVLAPISEMYGRRHVMNVSIVLLLLLNAACGLTKNTAQMLVIRFMAGCAAAPPLSVGAAAISDMFNDEQRNLPMMVFCLGPLLAPVAAPIIAGFTAQYLAWQWVFWILALINLVAAIVGVSMYEETYGPAILGKRAKRLRKETGNPELHTVYELVGESFGRRLVTAVTRPITILITQPIVFGLGLFMAVVYGLMYLMLVTFPQLWSTKYNLPLGIGSLMYIGLGVGFAVGVAAWSPITQKTYMWLAKRNNGVAEPEFRLVCIPFAAVLAGVGLIIYGQTAERVTFWLWPVIGTGIFSFALVCIFTTIQNYLIDAAVENWAASTVGAASIFRSSMGATFPLFGPTMYKEIGYAWAGNACGIAAFVLGIPFPILVFFYGKRIRDWTARRVAARAAAAKPDEQDSQV